MFAFVSTAGGCVEYRLFKVHPHNLAHDVRVERWCQAPHPSGDDQMVRDIHSPPEYYPNLLRAMIAIADDMEK